jgi:NADPH:quinone reductase-like Zn-dependent oxidoreductase
MQARRIERFGSVDGIEPRSTDDPQPGLREILMRVRASSLNYRDLMVLKGGGRGPTKLGVIPLSDGAGKVAVIGDGVTRVKSVNRSKEPAGDGMAGGVQPILIASMPPSLSSLRLEI